MDQMQSPEGIASVAGTISGIAAGGFAGSKINTKINAKKITAKDVKRASDSKEKAKVTSNKGNVYDNTPSDNHSTTNKNPGLKGGPNSSVDILDKDGNIKTRRWFDSDGNQMRDLDMTNHGNSKKHPEVPHEHGPRLKK